MKRSNFLQLALIALCLAITVVGCKKTPKNVTTLKNPTADTPGGPGPQPPIQGTPRQPGLDPGRQILPGEGTTQTPINTPPYDPTKNTPLPDTRSIADMDPIPGALAAETIYFEFDRSNVRAAERSKLEAVAAYLKNNATHKVEVAGHCDERGTEEYNRALGERRALSAREYLLSLGISGDRIFTISYGEDKAADPGHDESAWSKNRRDEFMAYRPKQP